MARVRGPDGRFLSTGGGRRPRKPVTKSKDLPVFKSIKKEMKALSKRPYVKIGIVGEDFDLKKAISEEGVEFTPVSAPTLGEVAFWNEFGTEHSPERSFIRSTYDNNVRKWKTISDKFFERVTVGQLSTEKALKKMGFLIETAVKSTITNLREPPNDPKTIAKKGSSNPLIDTTQMRNSITHRVDMSGKRED